MSVTQSFGLTVRKYREQQKISQEEFANRAGLDRTYISGIERGRRNPSLITIERLATALGIDLATLFQMMCKTYHSKGAGKK
jgi:transcriptional regulator with XRE-family HTH domain